MITLNFGISGYDVTDKDRIIKIPEKGRSKKQVPVQTTPFKAWWHLFLGCSEKSDFAKQSLRTKVRSLISLTLGELPEKCTSSVSEPRKTSFKPEKTERYFPAVIFNSSANINNNDSIIILWIEERKEWIAFHYQEWLEGWRGQDNYYYGPYSPDFVCYQQILKAYGKTENIFSRDVLRTSPSELEKI